MSDYKKILFPMDVADPSPTVAEHVKKLLPLLGAELHMLYVSPNVSDNPGATGKLEQQTIEGAKAKIKEFMDKSCQGLDYQSHILGGIPEETIPKFAQAEKMDIIIMGTHGRKGFDRLVSGSVTEGVIKKASIPVFVVKPFKNAA